ncbi:DMT family transporter [Alphaproteobacteria bacterium]|nr:DMT family transporter [Alphaproteobacteria bacterium]
MNAVKERALGVSTAVAAVTIWAVFLVNTRFAISSNFSVEEVMTLRLVTASIVTLPFMIKLGVLLRGQGFVSTIMIALVPSAVAPYIISSGLFYASASDSGALAPGTLPFWAALFSFLLIGEKPSKLRLVGLLAIATGALSVGLLQMLDGSSNPESWKGHLLFLLGACLWAIYTIYFKQARLRPVQGLVVGLFWGTLFLVPVLFMTGEVSFSNVSIREIVWVCLLQGVLIGVLAMILYSIAIRCLGAAQTGAFGALTPVLALFGGVVFLSETITTEGVMGIFLVAVGVILASGSFEKNT